MNFNARLTFTHPMSNPPYVKGAQMFLLNDPTIDFKYHGPPSKAFAQKLKEALLAYTKTKMSYPNQVALPLDPQAKPREVYTMAPKGNTVLVVVNQMAFLSYHDDFRYPSSQCTQSNRPQG